MKPCFDSQQYENHVSRNVRTRARYTTVYETGSAAGVQASHRERLRFQLSALDDAVKIEDMDIPGFRLYPLRGERKGLWAISVSGNWRITFEFRDGNAYVVNYEDYH